MISSTVKISRSNRNVNRRHKVSDTIRSCNKIPSGNGNEKKLAESQHSGATFTSFLPKSVVSSVGPASLVGGTAAIYTSLLQHPSSTLNQLSFVLMMLLAVQYAIQPRLSRKYISPKIKKQSVALVEEVAKTSFAAAIFFSKPTAEVQNSLKDWSLSSSLACAGLPAMLYALQGVLQYVSYQHLDSVTFNGLTQTKTLSAALCCWLIMKKAQSPLQMVALSILFGSALVFQGYIRVETLWKKNNGKNVSSTDTDSSTTRSGSSKSPATTTTSHPTKTKSGSVKYNDDWWWCGVIPCLGAAFLSGLAGALSQKGLQLTGIRGRDPFLYTIEISLFSAITLLINMVRLNVFSEMEWQKQKAYWNWKTLIPIFMKASSGVITALVHKYAGSVSKGFALMFGLVLSNMIQLTMKQESLQSYQILGTFMIMLSTWLHFTNPP
eukprot:CAMPEP_0201246270 /NCGR_PEP_ID=MMETSP0852-20130820/50678_1 /ASSEMBLY_ACC=CAM_ASM_000632 /TAXON_ID=183588 /ORGANISM="Pseudo-nitzschia fraudulenta, Strain WWA7" /LENGTH=436 /DNA_ID=CAMNT_0047544383 /DNA_START=106 /DNA_END=1416 /DNA_ORIENTATION=+